MQAVLGGHDANVKGRAAMASEGQDMVVELREITLDYGPHRVLDEFSLRVRRGEFMALLGPSGSGKTTVLRTLAGFLTPTTGTVLVSGEDVTRTPPHKRGIGVVFQSFALFPHMTVVDNLAYSMKVRRMKKAQIHRRCEELLALVRLEDQGHKKPARLSGGQQQRVALARALAMDPEVLLLDEPLSNLDANLRRDVGAEIRRLQRETGTTSLMVTHDRQEAFGMADRVAVLRDGRIEQLGTPRELYRSPASRFLARFVGEANLIPGAVIEPGPKSGRSPVQAAVGRLTALGEAPVGADVDVLIRPEDLNIGGGDRGVRLSGVVVEAFYYGSSLVVTADVSGQRISLVASGSSVAVPEAGSAVEMTASRDDCILLPGGVD